MKDIEHIKNGQDVLAIIIYKDYRNDGVNFVTPSDFSQQLAFITKKKDENIQAHTHKIVKRDVHLTQETLFIKKGKLKVNFFDNDKNYLDSRILESGDVILLVSGGHGIEILEDVEMIEVKQGPYLNDDDKVRF